MVSVPDAVIHGLVGEARAGSDPALERLVGLFLEAEEIKQWARKRAETLKDNAIQEDEILSFFQDAIWHAAQDAAGSVRWDAGRQVPFCAWIFYVVRTRHIGDAVRHSTRSKRSPRPLAWYGLDTVQPSPEAAVSAQADIELYVSALRKAGKVRCARVLELLSIGLSFSDVAYEIFGEATTNRRKVVTAAFREAKRFCQKKTEGHEIARLCNAIRSPDRDRQFAPACAG